MFNGIIKNTGKVKKILRNKPDFTIEISTNLKFSKKEIGSSISCSGACLTLEKYKNKLIKFYISNETLKKTNFNTCKIGDIINLEKSMKFGNRISGHFVQGHVDTTSRITKIDYVGRSWLVNFKLLFFRHLQQ